MEQEFNKTSYYILTARNPKRMLLYSLDDPTDNDKDGWMLGKLFKGIPEVPVVAEICTGYENAELLPFFENPPLMTDAFYRTLCDAGVENLIAFDAIIRSEDESITHHGYKAINIIGMVRASGEGTIFTGNSKLIDASIDSLEIASDITGELLMFRLAENVSAIVVHERVKQAIEAKGFPYLVFLDPGDYFTL